MSSIVNRVISKDASLEIFSSFQNEVIASKIGNTRKCNLSDVKEAFKNLEEALGKYIDEKMVKYVFKKEGVRDFLEDNIDEVHYGSAIGYANSIGCTLAIDLGLIDGYSMMPS
ncbi:MAG: hypothetical protein WCJ33_03650 [Pseudomonadota bacterium]